MICVHILRTGSTRIIHCLYSKNWHCTVV